MNGRKGVVYRGDIIFMDWDIPESIIVIAHTLKDNVLIFNRHQFSLVKKNGAVIIG